MDLVAIGTEPAETNYVNNVVSLLVSKRMDGINVSGLAAAAAGAVVVTVVAGTGCCYQWRRHGHRSQFPARLDYWLTGSTAALTGASVQLKPVLLTRLHSGFPPRCPITFVRRLQIDIEGNYGTVPASAITNLTRRLRIAVQAVNPWASVSFDLSFNAHLPSYQVRGQ